ncbi:hypothetical protein ABPG75_004624 [Micractinium tetrahymenae]
MNPSPEVVSGGIPASLPLTLTLPDCAAGGAGSALPFGTAPFPVLIFFSGFMNRASWYWRLVRQAASWGVLVLQYDISGFPTAAAELHLFPELIQWLNDQSVDPGNPLYGQVDLGRLATAGHSRGGKLAALAFAGTTDYVSTAYLIDPVDNTRYSPESQDNPSAVKALAAGGLAVGISAAGRTGNCNPADSNYAHFFAAAGNGSWLGLVAGAAHAQFADAGCIANAAADLLCGRGRGVSRPAVAALTATPMLAWLWEQLEGQEAAEGGSAGPSPLPAFYQWVAQQQAAGRLQFEVKGEAEAVDWVEDAEEAQAQAPAGAPAAGAAPAPAVELAAGEDDEECGPAAPAAEAAGGAVASQRRFRLG